MAARPKPIVLAALPNRAYQIFSSSLPSSLRPLYVKDYAEAVEVLSHSDSVALVVAGLFFDDTRVLDLMSYCRSRTPKVRVVCCRLLETAASPAFLEAVRTAAESSSCAFIDFPALAAASDEPAAHRILRERVLAELGARKKRRRASKRPAR